MGKMINARNKQLGEYIKGLSEDTRDIVQTSQNLDFEKIFLGLDTFTGSSDFLCKKYNLNVSAVFGKIYRLSRNAGFSWATYKNIGEDLGINEKTVKKSADILEAEKLIFD